MTDKLWKDFPKNRLDFAECFEDEKWLYKPDYSVNTFHHMYHLPGLRKALEKCFHLKWQCSVLSLKRKLVIAIGTGMRCFLFFFFSFFFFFFLKGHSCGLWKFSGQGSNLSELWLQTYTTATATLIPYPLSKAGNQIHILIDTNH